MHSYQDKQKIQDQFTKYIIQEDYVSREKKQMNTLLKYIKMVLTNMKLKTIQESLSTVEILIHTLTLFQIGNAFWAVAEIAPKNNT